MAGSTAAPQLTLTRWLAANAVILGALYLLGVALFVVFTERLDNAFALEARTNHQWLIVRVQLGLLPAYAVIWLVHSAVSWPLARRLAARWAASGRSLGRGGALGAALLSNVVVTLIGLGPQTALAPGSLDLLARLASRASSLDLYAFKTWHLQDFFCVLAAAALLLLVGDVVRGLGDAMTAWAPMTRRATWAALGVLVGVPAGAPLLPRVARPPKPVAHPNVLIVASDSLRWDHLSAHGYPRKTSPNIDALAKESVDFDNFFVSTASTLESWGSFLTGQFPAHHGLRYMFISKDDAEGVQQNPDTLPRSLARAGYRTTVFGDWAANCFSLVDFGFGEAHVSEAQTLEVFLSEVALRTHVLVPYYFGNGVGEHLIPNMRQVTGYLDTGRVEQGFLDAFDGAAADGQPFMGVLFVGDTHLPFQSPAPWNTMFVDPNYRGPNRYAIDFKIDDFIKYGFAASQPPEVRQHIVDLYDGGVARFDAMVGRIVAHLKARGLEDDTILIVTSDHGDDLYDPGTTLGHGTNFFGGDQSTRIPVVLRLPHAQGAGTRVRGIARNIDLAPTLLALTGAGEQPVGMDGASLVPYFDGSEPDLGLAAFAETCYLFYPKKLSGESAAVLAPMDETLFIDRDFRNLFVLKPEWRQPILETKDRMLRTDRWKLVYIKGTSGAIWRLYDMKLDPHQEHDLGRARSDVVNRLQPLLQEWMRSGDDQPWRRSWGDGG